MKKIEKISIITILLGLLFKHMYWKGADEMLILGFFSLALLYLVFAFNLFNSFNKTKGANRNITAQRIIFGLAIGFSSFTVLLGMLFKIQLWKGRDDLLLFGLAILIPALFILLLNGNKLEYRPSLKRIAILCITGTALYSINIRIQMKYHFRDVPELIEPTIEWYEKGTREAWEKVEEARRKVEEKNLPYESRKNTN